MFVPPVGPSPSAHERCAATSDERAANESCTCWLTAAALQHCRAQQDLKSVNRTATPWVVVSTHFPFYHTMASEAADLRRDDPLSEDWRPAGRGGRATLLRLFPLRLSPPVCTCRCPFLPCVGFSACVSRDFAPPFSSPPFSTFLHVPLPFAALRWFLCRPCRRRSALTIAGGLSADGGPVATKAQVRHQRDDCQVDQTGLHNLFGAASIPT